jgi:hypothetical protein
VANKLQAFRQKQKGRNNMDMAQRCQWRWLHQGVDLCMRVAAHRAQRAWYVIHPVAKTRAVLRSARQTLPLRDAQVYHVRRFEAAELDLARVLQHKDSHMCCTEEFFACGDGHLSDRLQQRGLTIATFYPVATAQPAERDGLPVLRPMAL